MKIAYFSPFNPLQSGISDFSEELVMKLKDFVEIDIFVDGYKPSSINILNNFEIFDIKDIYDDTVRKKYDHLVYHIGNNAKFHSNIIKVLNDFSGICELHDISLHNLIEQETLAKNKTNEYINIMKYCHGAKGEKAAKLYLEGKTQPPWESSLEYTLSKHVIDKSKAVIVHSDMAKQMVKGINDKIPVINIPLHTVDIVDDCTLHKIECRKKLKLDNNILIFASFGLASKSKRILEIIEAISIYKSNNSVKFQYLIVGDVQGIDIETKIKALDLKNEVKIIGYTEIDKFKMYMGACDIAFNLRYPTQGESSGSLHRLLGMGKPVIVTNIGSFQEYPDNIIFKVDYDENEVEEIVKAICTITNKKQVKKNIGKQAIEYARINCSLENNAIKYFNFYEDIMNNTIKEDILDSLIDKLFELGITDDQYIEHLVREKLDGNLI